MNNLYKILGPKSTFISLRRDKTNKYYLTKVNKFVVV